MCLYPAARAQSTDALSRSGSLIWYVPNPTDGIRTPFRRHTELADDMVLSGVVLEWQEVYEHFGDSLNRLTSSKIKLFSFHNV